MDAISDKRTAAERTNAPPDFKAEARAQLKTAEAQLAIARSELAAFVSRHMRWTDTGHIYVSGKGREQLDGELRLKVTEYDERLKKFHAALASWARQQK